MKHASRRVAAQRGFSLLELLLVVLIIGIVAGITIPRLIASRRAAQEGRAIANLRNLGSAEFAFDAAAKRFGNFQELVDKQAMADQFTRNVGGSTGDSEVISDGTYGYSITFDPQQTSITIDATPLANPETYRWFRFSLGRGGSAGERTVLMYAPPSASQPPSAAYKALGT